MSRRSFTVLTEGKVWQGEADVRGDRVRLSRDALRDAVGFELKSEGLCKGPLCVPVRDRSVLVVDEQIDLAVLADLLGRPLAVELEAGAASLGESARDQTMRLETLEAPDFELPDVDGNRHRLSEHRGRKIVLHAFASWCGCREELSVWQRMHEELSPAGLSVFGVALDRSADDIRPHLERHGVTFPSVVDPEHRVAELYGIINIPTVIWIDEALGIVRPPRIEPATNMFQSVTGLDCEPHLAALRNWVESGVTDLSAEQVRAGHIPPTQDEQLARTEFALAWHLEQHGAAEAAERHFARADQLAPHDWTIRRGSMPIRGMDPMGNDFFAVWQEWEAAGKPDYKSIAAERRRR